MQVCRYEHRSGILSLFGNWQRQKALYMVFGASKFISNEVGATGCHCRYCWHLLQVGLLGTDQLYRLALPTEVVQFGSSSFACAQPAVMRLGNLGKSLFIVMVLNVISTSPTGVLWHHPLGYSWGPPPRMPCKRWVWVQVLCSWGYSYILRLGGLEREILSQT
jgi:hypothetical protein